MTITKFTKGMILGICLSVISTTAVFASSGETKPAAVQPPDAAVTSTGETQPAVGQDQQPELLNESTGSSGAGVSGTDIGTISVDEVSKEILEKQNEIDQKVFDRNAKEITDKGISVTYTAPTDSYVEVGITPYSDENANYLYEILGRDMVKVVEGQQAELFAQAGMHNAVDTVAAAKTVADSIEADGAEAAEADSPMSLAWIYALAALALLGGAAGTIVARKRIAAKR